NELAVDKIMEVGSLSGYSINKGVNKLPDDINGKVISNNTKPTTNAKTTFVVCISKMEWKTYPKRRDVEYDDFVYCVEVPSGCIVTRRGKRTAISGNCIHRKAYH